MANSSEPRVGQLNHRCPHCCTPDATFVEDDVYEALTPENVPGAPPYVSLEQSRIGEPQVLFARQRCLVCDGVLIFAGDEMIFPKVVIAGRYDTWPADLRKRMELALLYYPLDPVVVSARLRGMLRELCVRDGLPQTITYADYLLKRLDKEYHRDWLTTTCVPQGKCLDPDTFYHADDHKCASFLLELVHVAAWTLFKLHTD